MVRSAVNWKRLDAGSDIFRLRELITKEVGLCER
jgi:hypothetical protein